MKKATLLIWALVSLNAAFAQENRAEERTNLELAHTQVIPIIDSQAERQYELYIKLPAGYSENTNKRYPVVYYTDAMWHTEILSAATEYIIEEVVLVGISWQKDISEDLLKEHGAHVSRFRDYSVIPSGNAEHQAKYQFGQASHHLDFIRNDVIKYVENNYRTVPDNRTYFGYSLGGVLGAYILLSQPDTFKNYILGSPSLKGDIPYLTELASNGPSKNQRLNTNVFISYGTLEEELGGYADQLITMLKARKDKGLSLNHQVIQGSHSSAFPKTGVESVTWLSNLIKQ